MTGRRDLRIVSLLPAATEILFELGLEDQLVGVSHECDHPPEATQKPRVTGSRIEDRGSSADIDRQMREAEGGEPLFTIDEELFAALEPDLVVTQRTCRVCAVRPEEIERVLDLLPRRPEVLVLSSDRVEGALGDILAVAGAAGAPEKGHRLVASLRHRLERVTRVTGRIGAGPTITAIEWLDPLLLSGHWVPEMIRLAGGRQVPDHEDGPVQPVRWDSIRAADPEFLLVAPCGFNVGRALEEIDLLTRRPGYERMRAPREGKVYVADGNAYFSRPGPRLVDGIEILAQLLHPRVFPGLIQVTENELYPLLPVV